MLVTRYTDPQSSSICQESAILLPMLCHESSSLIRSTASPRHFVPAPKDRHQSDQQAGGGPCPHPSDLAMQMDME